MPQDVERQKIIDYIVKVYEERGVPPSAREINRVLGKNNHGYLYEYFRSINEAYKAAGVESTSNSILKTQAATLARKKEYQQAEVIDLTSLGQPTQEDEEEENVHNPVRSFTCPSCRTSLHCDENNNVLCPNCLGLPRCSHGNRLLFIRALDLSITECGCRYDAPDRQNRSMNHLRFDPYDCLFKLYPPGKPAGYTILPNGNRIPA